MKMPLSSLEAMKKNISVSLNRVRGKIVLSQVHAAWLLTLAKLFRRLSTYKDYTTPAAKMHIKKLDAFLSKGLPKVAGAKTKGTTASKHAFSLVRKANTQINSRVVQEENIFDGKYVDMVVNDAADLLRVGLLLQSGKILKAFYLVEMLDTAVREEVPSGAYRFMERAFEKHVGSY